MQCNVGSKLFFAEIDGVIDLSASISCSWVYVKGVTNLGMSGKS